MEPNPDLVDPSGAEDPLKTYCATHPKVETRLRCGKCDTPICPKCLVYTPVGARCRTCADVRPLPTFQVGSNNYARAIGVGIAVVVVVGFLWALIGRAIPILSLWMVLLVGYAAGEAISRAVGRKRGRGLQVVAGLTVVLAFAARGVFLVLAFYPGAVDPALLANVAVDQIAGIFTNLIGLLVFALSVYIAASRL